MGEKTSQVIMNLNYPNAIQTVKGLLNNYQTLLFYLCLKSFLNE